MKRIRIGNYIYVVVPSLHYPYYAISHKCGRVQGGHIIWYH